jgi:hypothetical protein
MSTIYKPFGCFNLTDNNFSINLTNLTKEKYTIEECKKAAIDNKSYVFGLNRIDENTNKGSCFISDSNITPLQQSYNSVKDGFILNKCLDGFGNTSNNSIFVYVNDKALNFFDDINVSNIETKNQDIFLNTLNKLNNDFSKALEDFRELIEKKFKPYNNNDLGLIFNKDNLINLDSIQNKLNTLSSDIEKNNVEIFNEIQILNQEIKNLDNYIEKAKKDIKKVTNSDNAALGNVTDINYRTNSIIAENIALIIIPFLLIGLFLSQKKK